MKWEGQILELEKAQLLDQRHMSELMEILDLQFYIGDDDVYSNLKLD